MIDEPDGSFKSNIAYADEIIDRLDALAKHMDRHKEGVKAAAMSLRISRSLMMSDLHDIDRRVSE